MEELKQSLVALPIVLSDLQSKIVSPPPPLDKEKTLVDYIIKIFNEQPKSWFNYAEIEKRIHDNPITENLLQECYRKNALKKFRKILPAWVGSLRERKFLVFDENSNSFRLNPFLKDSSVDANFGEDIKSKEIIDEVEKAQNALLKNDFYTVRLCCISILEKGVNGVCDCYKRQIDNQNLDELFSFLRTLDIDIKDPMPLEKLLGSTLKKSINAIDEAKIALQNTILYIRRLYKKIHEVNRYKRKNETLLEEITRRTKGRSHKIEREYFKENLLPILMEDYGKLVNFMFKIKIGYGYADNLPDELQILRENNIIKSVNVYKCPGGEHEFIASGISELPFCNICKVQMEKFDSGFQITQEAYESWNIWLEEYIKFILEKLPIFYVESGLILGYPKKIGVSAGNELDVVLLFDGKAIAIECKQILKCNKEINEVENLINKIESLDIFDATILVYQEVENLNIFTSTVGKYEKELFPILVESPKKMENTLKDTLLKIKAK